MNQTEQLPSAGNSNAQHYNSASHWTRERDTNNSRGLRLAPPPPQHTHTHVSPRLHLYNHVVCRLRGLREEGCYTTDCELQVDPRPSRTHLKTRSVITEERGSVTAPIEKKKKQNKESSCEILSEEISHLFFYLTVRKCCFSSSQVTINFNILGFFWTVGQTNDFIGI